MVIIIRNQTIIVFVIIKCIGDILIFLSPIDSQAKDFILFF